MRINEILKSEELEEYAKIGLLFGVNMDDSYIDKHDLEKDIKLRYAFEYANKHSHTDCAWNKKYEYILSLSIDEILKIAKEEAWLRKSKGSLLSRNGLITRP